MRASVDRNMLQANHLSQKLSIPSLFSSKTVSNIRAQNIVRFYEKAIKAIRSQKQNFSQEKESVDPMTVSQNEFTEKYILAKISFFIALHYVTDQNAVKQALVVLQNCQYKIEEAVEFYQQNGLKSDKSQ